VGKLTLRIARKVAVKIVRELVCVPSDNLRMVIEMM